MKAIVNRTFGIPDVIQLTDVEKPVPGDDEVLVKVHASSVTTSNLMMVSGRPRFVRLMGIGLVKPARPTPGGDVAGVVEATGAQVKEFERGDEVYGELSLYGYGAYAEYVAVPERALARKPANLSFEEAAAVPESALVALQGLRDKGQIRKGRKVVIFGASGGIGTFAVQIAKYYGAEVTGVCGPSNTAMVRSIGVDQVIDYTREDYTRSGIKYDLIFATHFRRITDHLRALRPGGNYVSTGSPSIRRIVQDMLTGPLIAKLRGRKVAAGWVVKPNKQDLDFLRELIEAGHVKPVIDRCYPLSEAAEAFRHYGKGHARGKVIITVPQNGNAG